MSHCTDQLYLSTDKDFYKDSKDFFYLTLPKSLRVKWRSACRHSMLMRYQYPVSSLNKRGFQSPASSECKTNVNFHILLNRLFEIFDFSSKKRKYLTNLVSRIFISQNTSPIKIVNVELIILEFHWTLLIQFVIS